MDATLRFPASSAHFFTLLLICSASFCKCFLNNLRNNRNVSRSKAHGNGGNDAICRSIQYGERAAVAVCDVSTVCSGSHGNALRSGSNGNGGNGGIAGRVDDGKRVAGGVRHV